MRKRIAVLVVGALIGGAWVPAQAGVLCANSSGALSLRSSCLYGETSVSPSSFGVESRAYSTFGDPTRDVPHNFGASWEPVTAVGGLDIPTSGKYVMVAKAIARSDSGNAAFVVCRLFADGDYDESAANVTRSASTLSFNVTHTFNYPGRVNLLCTDFAATAAVKLQRIKITAIKVGKLSNTPMQ
jgi:hypothetical protein